MTEMVQNNMSTSLLETLQATPMIFYFIVPLFFLFLLSKSRRKRLPPGPTGWPLIGNMMMMDQLTHRGLAKLAQKYGGVFHLKMGYVHKIVVSGPDEARQVLQEHDIIFSNRPATAAISYLTYDRADMAFADYGLFWRQMRKLCVMKLFSRKRAESWDSVRDEVDSMVRIVTTNTGTAVNLGELVFSLTRNIIYRAAFGTCSEDGQEEFIKIMQEFSKLFGAFNIADFIPWLGWVGKQSLNIRLAKARASLDGFIDSIIDDHIMRKKAYVNGKNDDGGDRETDMVDELLAFYSEEAKVTESEDLQNAIRLTKDNIKAIIMDVMFGGTETVASAIEWAMAELMRSPEDLKKVQQELANVVGLNRKVEESDFEKLTYLKCCLKETLRLHPPIPLLLHETAEESTVSGYHIPAKSHVIINSFAIGRDKNSWEDPETYKPSRFLKEGVPDFKGGNFEFIPFGSGRRSCPGMQLGLYALEMAVAHLLHCFTWELPDGMKPSELKMDDIFGLTAPRANRLVAVPSPRLLCPLY
ncbi:PREDICTED: cytochrome P450 84A1-like [Nicotiana attenuata]|uniref:Cytochrome p450 84a1 n=1 Tax=Nicotiana attenuata TaxID=49451 RepID=A0A1J6KHY7_NICAT|nr:PREDICTED: cytochrome P450 84A1-like [Nicotiana attenuata]OIT22419.1 cytochrome p450 84a1 [Nicotiana attenuata]